MGSFVFWAVGGVILYILWQTHPIITILLGIGAFFVINAIQECANSKGQNCDLFEGILFMFTGDSK